MAVTANIHDAKTNLSKLIERAVAGEEVIIAKAGKPLVRLEPIETAKPQDRRRILGAMRGKITFAPDWDSPETNAEIERLFYGEEPAVEALRGVAEE